MAEYKGRHIVKHEKKNGITVETYVEFEEGQVYLNTYVNFKLYSRIHVADLASKDIAADVAPVVHGEWIPMHHRGLGGVQRVRGGLRCKRQWWNDRLRAVLRLLQILPHLRGKDGRR